MSYINTKVKSHSLLLILTKEGRKELKAILRNQPDWNDVDQFHHLIDQQLCNGFTKVDPDYNGYNLGLLTSDPFMISDDCKINDQGDITEIETLYHYPDYMVRSPIDELLKTGSVELSAA